MSLRYNLNCPRLSADCRKCYAESEDGTIDRSAYMTPCCYAVPCGIPSVVILTYAYTDDWGRPTYKAANGMRFKDVNCGRGKPSLHTVTSAGEPDCPVRLVSDMPDELDEFLKQYFI